MHDIVIKNGWYRNNEQKRNAEFELYDNNLGQLWSNINSIFSSPAYSSDHLFALIESDAVDLNKEADLKTLAGIIDASPEFQNELLSLSCFGGREEKPFVETFKGQPQFANYLFQHCPKFVTRIEDEHVLRRLLLEFPGTAPVLISKPYSEDEATKDVATKLLHSINIYDEVFPLLTTLPEGAEASYFWRALSFLYRDERNHVRSHATSVVVNVAKYQPEAGDESRLTSLHSLLYQTPEDQKKQLLNVFIEFPAIFKAACGEQNQHLATLLSSQNDPLEFLAALGKSEAGREVIAEKIEDIALYILENFEQTDPKVQRLFLEPATEDAPETYRKLIAKHIGSLLKEMADDKIDYTTLAMRVSKLLSYDIIRQEIGLDFQQLMQLMRMDDPKQCDPLLERYIGGDELLASRLMAYQPYKDVVFTSKTDAQNRDVYLYSRAFWIIRDQLSEDLAQNLNNNEFVSSHFAYMFITKDEWWNEVTPFTFGYLLLALMAAIASVISNSLKKYFDDKLGKRVEPLQSKNLLFRMRCDYELQSKKTSFDDFLIANTPVVVTQPAVTSAARLDAMRLWFSVAKAADIYNLMSQNAVHEDIKEVFHEKPIYQALFLQELRKQENAAPAILSDFEDDLDDEEILENMCTPNKGLQQRTLKKVDSARKVKIMLEEDLSPEKTKNIPDNLGILDYMLTLPDEVILRDYTAEKLLRFFKLNKASHQRFFAEKPVARAIILQQPTTLVEVASEKVFKDDLIAEPGYLIQFLETQDLSKDTILALLRNGSDLLEALLLLELNFEDEYTQQNLKAILNGFYGEKVRRIVKKDANVEAYLAVLKDPAVTDMQKTVINDLCVKLNSDPSELDTSWMAKLLGHEQCDQQALLAMVDIFSIAKPGQLENMIKRNDRLLALEDDKFAATLLEFMAAKERSQLVVDLLPKLMSDSKPTHDFFQRNPQVLVSVLKKLNEKQLKWLFEHFDNVVVQQAILQDRALIERVDPSHEFHLTEAKAKNLASLIADGKAQYVYNAEEFKDHYLSVVLDIFKQNFAGFDQRAKFVAVLHEHLKGVLDSAMIRSLVIEDKMSCGFFKEKCPQAFEDFVQINLHDVIQDGTVVLDEQFLISALDKHFENTIEQLDNEGLRKLFLNQNYKDYAEFFSLLFKKHPATLGQYLKPKDWMQFATCPVLFNAALSMKGDSLLKSPEKYGLSFEMFLLLARQEQILAPLCEIFARKGVPEFVCACYHQASKEDKQLLKKTMIRALRDADPAKYARSKDEEIKPFGDEAPETTYFLDDTLKLLRMAKYPGVPDEEPWSADKVLSCVNDKALAAVSVLFYPHLQNGLENRHCEPLNKLLLGIGEVEIDDALRKGLKKLRPSSDDDDDSYE